MSLHFPSGRGGCQAPKAVLDGLSAHDLEGSCSPPTAPLPGRCCRAKPPVSGASEGVVQSNPARVWCRLLCHSRDALRQCAPRATHATLRVMHVFFFLVLPSGCRCGQHSAVGSATGKDCSSESIWKCVSQTHCGTAASSPVAASK